jgi:hypothetical protein
MGLSHNPFFELLLNLSKNPYKEKNCCRLNNNLFPKRVDYTTQPYDCQFFYNGKSKGFSQVAQKGITTKATTAQGAQNGKNR